VFSRGLEFIDCLVRLTFLRVFLIAVLHDERDTSVRGIKRVLWLAQELIGEAPHLGYLLRTKTFLLHESPCRVRAIGGKFPVAVVSFAAVGLRVRVPFDGNLVRQLA
jgi:hypothetical protein